MKLSSSDSTDGQPMTPAPGALRTVLLLCLLSVFCFNHASQAQPLRLDTQAANGGSGDWSQASQNWYTNGGSPTTTLANPQIYPSEPQAAGVDFEAVNNGVNFWGGATPTLQTVYANTGVRTPTTANWIFYARSLTLDSGTLLGFKNATETNGAINWGGTNSDPTTGLIFKVGSGMNIRDSAQYTNTGVISWGADGPGPIFQVAGSSFGSGGTGGIVWEPTALYGSGDLVLVNNPTTQSSASMLVGTNNNGWTGSIQVKCGYIQVSGYNPLGGGNVVCNPSYDLLNTGYWNNAIAGPAIFEPLTDINSRGTLTLVNGGQIVLHQDVLFSAVTIEGNSLAAGTYSYGQLQGMAPNDFPSPGSGSIIVGSFNPNTVPNKPVNVFTFDSGGQVTVEWDGGGNATGYIVLRSSTMGGPYSTVITNVSTAIHAITDSSVVVGNTYYYVVEATNSVGTSPPSTQTSGTSSASVTGVTANVGIDQVTLTWSPFAGAVTYTVQRSASQLGPYTNLVTGLTTTNYVDTVPQGTAPQTLYYSIIAVLTSGTSGNSSPVSALQGAGYVEEWTAYSLTNTLGANPTNNTPVTDWYGNILNTDANADLNSGGVQLTPFYNTTSTPKGQPSVHFFQTNLAELNVGATPVAGLTTFTETIVFRANVTGTGANNWYSMTGITDAEQGGVTYDWGLDLDATGHIDFGIGDPDTTDQYTNSVLVGGYHVAVLVWDSAAGQIRETVDNYGTLVYNTAPPPVPRNANGNIHIGRSSDGGTSTPYFLDGDIAELGIMNFAATPAFATNLVNILNSKYGYTTLKTYITNFTATPNPVPKGQSVTLSWQVQAGATVSITPSTALPAYTTNASSGAGSVTFVPTGDANYTLIAQLIQGGASTTISSNIAVLVSGTASNSLIDSFVAADLTNTLNGNLANQSPVTSWNSHSNLFLGTLDSVAETPPVFLTNGGLGKPVVAFQGGNSSVGTAGYLRLTNSVNGNNADSTTPSTNDPLGGLSAYTVAIVFQVNSNLPPTVGQGNWYNEMDLVDGEEPGAQNDYGFTLNSAGTATLGVGQGDQSIHGNGGTLVTDGNYHIYTGVWSGVGQIMELYVDGVSAASLTGSTVPASPRNYDTTAIGGPHPAYNASLVFSGNIAEIDFYNAALPTNEVLNLYTNLGIKYGIVNTNLYISSFTANASTESSGAYSVTAGAPVTLSWVISPTNSATTNITITGIGNVSSKTSANGIGSITVTPEMDTNYTLSVGYANDVVGQNLSIDVHQTAGGSLIDSFLASDEASLGNGQPVPTWVSHNGLFFATPDPAAGSPPTFLANGGNGKPTINFEGQAMRFANNGSTPVSGLLSWTVAIVYQPDTENPPSQASQQFYGETALLGGDIGGAGQGDIGIGISSNGLVMFGTGGAVGDNGIYGTTKTMNTNYHIAVVTWGILSGTMALYVDGNLQAIQTNNIGTAVRSPTEALVIAGNTSSTANQQFNGNISQISFYSDDLQTNQVATLIDSLAAQYGVNLSNGDAPYVINNTGTGLTGTPGQFQLSWNASFGAVYTILETTNLAIFNSWKVVGAVTNTGNNTVLQFIDTTATNAIRFYQIVTP